MYELHVGGRDLTINTQNIRAEVARDQDPAAIGRFLEHVLGADADLPQWSRAIHHLFPMLESIDLELGPETVTSGLTDRTKVVLALHERGSGCLRFVSKSDLAVWGVSVEEAWEASHAAFAKIVAETRIEILKAGDLSLGTVHAAEPYKASMILSRSLKHQVPDELGWPILAVAPARDFVYLLRMEDEGALGRVGAVVVREYRQSGYPVSGEVWQLSDDGAKAIGSGRVMDHRTHRSRGRRRHPGPRVRRSGVPLPTASIQQAPASEPRTLCFLPQKATVPDYR